MDVSVAPIFKKYYFRTDLVDRFLIDEKTYNFIPGVSEERKWSYYHKICRKTGWNDKIKRTHGMKSSDASFKKRCGHENEKLFESLGFTLKKGKYKTDLFKNDEPYASVKSLDTAQWDLRKFDNLNIEIKNIFNNWFTTFQIKDVERRKEFAQEIINNLSYYSIRNIIDFFFRKNENMPYLILKDVKEDIYYEVYFDDIIDVISKNSIFYFTKSKVKLVCQIKLNQLDKKGKNKKRAVFEIEPRSDKNNPILVHGKTKIILDIIKDYGIKINNTYKFLNGK